MNTDLEKLLSAPPDSFERVLYRTEEWLLVLERMIRYSAEDSATLDKSYDLMLAGLIASGDDDDAHPITAKTRDLVKQYRGFRDADTSNLLMHIFTELHEMHEIHRGRTP